MVKPVRLEIKARNNLVLTMMKQYGIRSVAELCRHTAKRNLPSDQVAIGRLINMKEPARRKDGEWSWFARALADFFYSDPVDLFSESQQFSSIEKNRMIAETSFAEIEQLTNGVQGSVTPELTSVAGELRGLIRESLLDLRPREERVLRLRFGLSGGGELTLEEIGEQMGINRERVRQIETKALNKLRRPSKSKPLRLAVGGIEISDPNRYRPKVQLPDDILAAL